MSPKHVLSQNRSKLNHVHNNIYAKKLKRTLITNSKLRKRIAELSVQNKELSTTRNTLLLEKIKLENERNSVRNTNIQLTALLHTGNRKLATLEQNLQTCVPALVTLSKCIPSMMESVREISKLDKFNEFSTGKKERLTKYVKPMINGYVIEQPTIRIKRLHMSPIVELPYNEQSPMTPRRSSNKYSVGTPHTESRSEPRSEARSEPRSEVRAESRSDARSEQRSEPRSEPYVRLKDVAALLKHSKAVPNTNPPRHQPNDHLGEGPSWLHSQENQTQNTDMENSVTAVTENSNNYSVILDEVSTSLTNEISNPVREETSISNTVQADVSTSNFSSNDFINSTSQENEMFNNESMSAEASMLRNITCRKRQKRTSSESSFASDNESLSSHRTRRSGNKRIDYKEKNLHTKLRRDN